MKTTLEDITAVKKKIKVEIDPAEVKKRLEKAYREVGKNAKIPGFRPGKIPKTIIVNRFGPQVAEDVSREIINESFPKALEELKTFPLGTPLLDKEPLEDGKPFTYSAEMEVRPEVDLKEYVGLEVEKETFAITDDDVETRLENIRKANGKLVSLEEERSLQSGDMALIDYQAYEDEKALEEMHAENFLLELGSGDFHPSFEKALEGLNKEDGKDIEVEFEEDFHNKELAGRKILFKTSVRDIKQVQLPELDDEFAKTLGEEFKDIASLKEKLREILEQETENRIDGDLKGRLLDKISSSVEFELPQVLVDSEIEYALESVRQNLQRSGSSIEKAALDEDKLREQFRPDAEKRCKNMLVLGEIADRENIEVEDEDMNKGFEEIAASTGQSADIIRRYYEARGMVDSLKEKMLEQKTLNYLVENAKIIEVDQISQQ